MNVTLNNIGIVCHADIKIKGITVIAGENGTGKSTINKALYCIFNASYKIEEEIEKTRKNLVKQLLYRFYSQQNVHLIRKRIIRNDINNLASELILAHRPNVNRELLKKQLREIITIDEHSLFKSLDLDSAPDPDLDSIIDLLSHAFQLSNEDLHKEIAEAYISSEFSNQINRIGMNESASITLKIKEKEELLQITNNEITSISGILSLYAKCIYVDNVKVADYLDAHHHQSHLDKLLKRNDDVNLGLKAIARKKLHHIMQLLNDICKGELNFSSSNELTYKEETTGQEFELMNTAAGLKIFLILKRLLTNDTLSDRGLVLFDEPEIHLHPKWQIILAQLIVLIQKEFNLHVLISTHSPYFLQAIEVYSEMHGINKDCCYYLTEIENNLSYAKDVTNSTERIYKKLAEPFQVMANVHVDDEK